MTETTAGATIETTATGHPSAPILAREAGVNPVDYMRSRGFVQDISDEEGLRELFDRGEPVTLYQGFDPTGPSLHAGHMVGIMMLGSMQRLGHRPIALGGGGTAMVGDPSGRTSARELIREEARPPRSPRSSDATSMRRLLGTTGGVPVNNADWLSISGTSRSCAISGVTSANEMLAAERKARLETTAQFRRVQLPPRAGYDFLHLFRTQTARQIGGSISGAIRGRSRLRPPRRSGKVYALVCLLITTAIRRKASLCSCAPA